MAGPYYGVDGDKVVGPFHDFKHAKQALKIPQGARHDQKLETNLYRYGRTFIGEHDRLVSRNIMEPRKREPFATHVAMILGRRLDNGHIETMFNGEWQELEPTLMTS